MKKIIIKAAKEVEHKLVKEKNLKRGIKAVKYYELNGALSYLNKAVEKDPQSDEALLNRGKLYYQLKRLPEAVKDLELAQKLNPKNSQVYGPLLLAYLKSDDLEHVAELINIKGKKSAIFYTALSFYHLKLQNYKEAVENFQKALKVKFKNDEIYPELIAIYNLLPEKERAQLIKEKNQLTKILIKHIEELFNKNENIMDELEGIKEVYWQLLNLKCSWLIDLDPTQSVAYTYRGEGYRRQAKRENSRFDLLQAIKLDPNNALAHAFLGFCYMDAGEYNRAKIEFEKAVKLDATCYIAYLGLSKLCLYQDNSPEAALAVLQENVKKYSSQYEKNIVLFIEISKFEVSVKKALGQDTLVEEFFLANFDSYSDDVNIEIFTALSSPVQTHRFDDSIQKLPDHLADQEIEHSKEFSTLFTYVNARFIKKLQRGEKFQQLVHALEKFLLAKLEKTPDNIAIHYYLGEMYRISGQFDKAVTEFEKFRSEYSAFPAINSKLNYLYQKQTKYEEAIESLNAIETPTADTFFNLANAHLQRKHIVSAVIYFADAEKLNKSYLRLIPENFRKFTQVYQEVRKLFVKHQQLVGLWTRKCQGDSFKQRGTQLSSQINQVSDDIANVVTSIENQMRSFTEQEVQSFLSMGVNIEMNLTMAIDLEILDKDMLLQATTDDSLLNHADVLVKRQRIEALQAGEIGLKAFFTAMKEIRGLDMEGLHTKLLKLLPEIWLKTALINDKTVNASLEVLKLNLPPVIPAVASLRELAAFTFFANRENKPFSPQPNLAIELNDYLTEVFETVSNNQQISEKEEEVDKSLTDSPMNP